MFDAVKKPAIIPVRVPALSLRSSGPSGESTTARHAVNMSGVSADAILGGKPPVQFDAAH